MVATAPYAEVPEILRVEATCKYFRHLHATNVNIRSGPPSMVPVLIHIFAMQYWSWFYGQYNVNFEKIEIFQRMSDSSFTKPWICQTAVNTTISVCHMTCPEKQRQQWGWNYYASSSATTYTVRSILQHSVYMHTELLGINNCVLTPSSSSLLQLKLNEVYGIFSFHMLQGCLRLFQLLAMRVDLWPVYAPQGLQQQQSPLGQHTPLNKWRVRRSISRVLCLSSVDLPQI